MQEPSKKEKFGRKYRNKVIESASYFKISDVFLDYKEKKECERTKASRSI